jgi:anti-sigma factor RsiW
MMEEKYEHWLPFYVNGTLAPSERMEMDRYLAAHPEARADVALFSQVAQSMNALANRTPERIGLDKAIAQNRSFASEKKGRTSSMPLSQSLLAMRVRDWFGRSWLQPAFAMALVVVGVQTVLLVGGDDSVQMRGAASTSTSLRAAGDVVYLRVSFAPTATEGELRVLLAGSGASFASGPDESGAYTVSVSADRVTNALERLRASRVVVSANPSAQL